MPVDWPDDFDTLPKPDVESMRDDPGLELDVVIADHATLLERIEERLGKIGNTPLANRVLTGNGTGQSQWDQVQTNMIAAKAVTVGRMNPGTTANRVAATTDGSNMTMEQIVNAMVASNAGIDLSKLASIGTEGHVVRWTAGGVVGSGFINNVNVADGADIALSKLEADGTDGQVVQQVSGSLALADLPVSGMTQLAKITVSGSAAANITFSNISGDYTTLLLTGMMRSTVAATTDSIYFRVNGNTDNIYDYQAYAMAASGIAAVESLSQNHCVIAGCTGANAPAGEAGTFTIVFPGYANTTWRKAADGVWRRRGAATSGGVSAGRHAGGWRSTDPVVTLTLACFAGDVDVGSFIALYGLV